MRLAVARVLPCGLPLVAAFEHRGAARALIHHLKYRGVGRYPTLVAEVLADHLPRLPIVPIPRAWSRHLKYGVDPTLHIARALGERLGVPVVRALGPVPHSPRRAGGDHSRPVERFRPRGPLPGRVLLLDDVVTTGTTIAAAVEILGIERVRAVVAANDATGGSILTDPVTSPNERSA